MKNCRCTTGPFDTAAELKDHLRKKHELFYCDICMEHLKVKSSAAIQMYTNTQMYEQHYDFLVLHRYFRLKGELTQGSSWLCTEEKVIQIINHIVGIRYANIVTNGIWIVMNFFGTYEKSTISAISVMLMDPISFMRKRDGQSYI